MRTLAAPLAPTEGNRRSKKFASSWQIIIGWIVMSSITRGYNCLLATDEG